MNASNYAVVALVRRKELGSRLALAAFIGAVAWIFAPSVWPIVWFAAVLITQALDWSVNRPMRRRPEAEPSAALRAAACACMALTVAVYASMSAYVWFEGGVTGRVFAMIFCAGGLLHVSLHMHQSRTLLASAVIPHALCFFGLPVASAILESRPSDLLVGVGCVLYMAHLVLAVRQASSTTRILRDAKRDADDERRKAEIASAAKSDFLAVISHEIRTPMNAVISAANLLRRTRLDRDQREHVSMLMDAGDVLLGLLNDVLDFSKIEAGKMELESAPTDVREKLAAMYRLWRPRASANGVRISLSTAPGLPQQVMTDPLRLQQILFNLVSNAVKFTAEGEIVVSAGWRAESRELVLEVRDTGCGIAPDRLAHIFDSFEQAEVGTTRRYGGTGLGLAISRRLAELMGGSLTVESRVDRGSTFRLVLPVAAVAEPPVQAPVLAPAQTPALAPVQTPAPAPAPAPGPLLLDDGVEGALSGVELLVADDHEVNRRIIGLLLAPTGARLTLVANGLEAVEAAQERPFDAILMDMQMPVMDGLEAARRIRQGRGPNRDAPVIALTANALDVHRAAWAELGAEAFLTKPIDPALLIRTVAGLVMDQDAIDQSAIDQGAMDQDAARRGRT
jgi:signal transduction histidine kinase/CheY-like chemotaxis protein